MVLLTRCCCWRSVRKGSFASGIFTLAIYLVLLVTSVFHVNTVADSAELLTLNIFCLIFSFFCVVSSVILLVGLCVVSAGLPYSLAKQINNPIPNKYATLFNTLSRGRLKVLWRFLSSKRNRRLYLVTVIGIITSNNRRSHDSSQVCWFQRSIYAQKTRRDDDVSLSSPH
ncbi:unnamed protein product [Larinioides sclopetarius]|uniref:NADH dehydrogenase subunit 6 n=1 Tax=Larinioides sclopetarius TaxID=280406 RepID=A0AAV1ZXK7_9ARAC